MSWRLARRLARVAWASSSPPGARFLTRIRWLVADHRLTVDQARARLEAVHGLDDRGIARRPVVPIARQQSDASAVTPTVFCRARLGRCDPTGKTAGFALSAAACSQRSFFSTIADNRVIDHLTEPLSQSDLATQFLLFRLTGT